MELTKEQIEKLNDIYSMAYDIAGDVDGVAVEAVKETLQVLGVDASFLEYVPLED